MTTSYFGLYDSKKIWAKTERSAVHLVAINGERRREKGRMPGVTAKVAQMKKHKSKGSIQGLFTRK